MKQLGNKINLVICQKSKISDWVNHFKNNYSEKTDFYVYDLTDIKNCQLEQFLEEVDHITKDDLLGLIPIIGIINYDLLWRRPELLKLHDFTLMLDESSLITNKTANRSDFILKLKPANVILLSGTPTAGKYEKLWSQLQLLGWNIDEDTYFKSYVNYEWTERDGYWDKKIIGYKNVDHLKKRLAKFGAIFKKTEEVMDLPDQIEQMVYIKPSKEYKFFKEHHYLQKEDKELIGDTVLTRILYERQLCGQYNDDKLTAFQELLRESDGRFIVFYNFNDELKKLMNLADGVDKPISIVNGNEKSLECYEQYDNSITFVQYQAGAYGLNLQKANKIIYFSLPLGIGSCDLWEQSKKRIHRIGQTQTCFYYYLLVENSIEMWNLELLKTGKELTDDLFEEVKK